MVLIKEYAQAFYKSKAWKQTREAYARSRGFLCERCLERGLASPGEIVHHKTWLTPENIKDPNVALSWDNLELVCRQCHADEHEKKQTRRWSIDKTGRAVTTPDRRNDGIIRLREAGDQRMDP